MARSLPRSTPEQEGVQSRRIIDALNEIELSGIELHSMMVSKNGRVIFEGHSAPYGPDTPHIIHSMTKTLTNTAVGIAWDSGLLSLDDRVADFFPEHLPQNPSENLLACRVGDLISMRSGQGREISGNEWRLLDSSWIAAFLREPFPHRPGTRFVYSSAASYMLSAIVQTLTDMTAHDYLRQAFLPAIGMEEFPWMRSPEGICSGGNGVSLTIESIVRLGMVYAQGGLWEGRQVLSREWVDRCLGRVDPREDGPEVPYRDTAFRYNYHFYQTGGVYASAGVFGQLCVVIPHLDMVVGLTSACPMNEDMDALLILKKHLVDRTDGEVEASARHSDILLQKGRRLNLLWPARSAAGHLRLPGATHYRAEPNRDGIRWMAVEPRAGEVVFRLCDRRGEHRVRCGLDRWIRDSSTITGGYLHHQYQPDSTTLVGMAWWESAHRLCMEWRYPEMTFCDYVSLTFQEEGREMVFDRRVSVNSQSMSRPPVRGLRLDDAREGEAVRNAQ